MALCKPRPTGSTSSSGDALQHDVAMRVQARIDADVKRKRRAELKQSISKSVEIVFLLMLVAGLVFVYQSGFLQRWFSGDAAQSSLPSVPSAEIAPAVVPPSPSESVKVDVDAKELVKKAERDFNAQRVAEDAFVGASLDFWKDAAAQDKPAKGASSVSFVGLVFGADGVRSFLNLSLGGASGFSASPLVVGVKAVEMPRSEFNRLVGSSPYLVAREGRAYVCSSAKRKLGVGKCAVPAKSAAFNPARADFGSLADEIARLKMRPSFRYKVSLFSEKFSRRVAVGSFAFGDEVPHSAFVAAVRRAMVDDSAAAETVLSAAVIEFAAEPFR